MTLTGFVRPPVLKTNAGRVLQRGSVLAVLAVLHTRSGTRVKLLDLKAESSTSA